MIKIFNTKRNNANIISHSIPILTGVLMCSQYYIYKRVIKNTKLDSHYYH